MFSAMLDFFCSRPFPDKSSFRSTLSSTIRALFWGFVAMIVGIFLAEDAAFVGEHSSWISTFTGMSITSQEAYPILWTIVNVFLGSSPSILALNILGAVVFGALVSCTWGVVRFWALDAANEESVPGSHRWISPIAADVACALLIFSFPGFLTASSFNANVWSFFLLLVCVLLQNRYALRGGHSLDMMIFASVLGICAIESAWVFLLLPLFFLRVVAIEWRLWDHNVRNLPVWFIAFVIGAVTLIVLNAIRIAPTFTFHSIWETQMGVARMFLSIYKSFMMPGIIIIFGASVVLPIVAWVTARRLLNNDRSLGLLIVGSVMTILILVLSFAFVFDKNSFIPQVLLMKMPLRFWLTQHGAGTLYPMLPVATMWINAAVLGMLTVGWGVQIVFKNPNNFEERDIGKIPRGVLAMRTGAFILCPILLIIIALTVITHAIAFSDLNRYVREDIELTQVPYSSMADQFGEYVVQQMLPNSTSLAAGHTYVASSAYKRWMIDPVSAAARRHNLNVVQFNTMREADMRYINWVKEKINNDSRLVDAGVDVRHFNDILDYNFNRFILTFFVSHPTVEKRVVVYDLCDYWYRARLRPVPAGALFIGVEDDNCEQYAEQLWLEHLDLREQWGFVKDYGKTVSSWTDVNVDTARQIAEHLAFVANNLGTYYDDIACRIGDAKDATPEETKKAETYLTRAIDCYRYANEMHPENAAAILNYYAICNTRPAAEKLLSPVDATLSETKFKDFIKETTEKKRLYRLQETIRYHGYIRDARLFVSAGLSWAIQAAPDAALATYRNAELNLSEMGDEHGAARIGAVMGAIYEEQGLLDLAEQKYLTAVQVNPNDINVLRQLMNLALQRGNLDEASGYLRRVEDIVGGVETQDNQLNATLVLDQAAYYIGIGNNEKARNLLARYTKDFPDDVVGWSMLAMLSIDEGRLSEVRSYISANIRRAKNTSPYYTHILDGRLAQAEAEQLVKQTPNVLPHENQLIRKKYQEARAHYRSAYASRPNVANVVQLILQIDFILHDGVDAIRDAETLLQCDPQNPMALYAIGMKRLEDAILFGEVGAEGYFRRAIESSKNRRMQIPLELLVNTADVLARTDNMTKLTEAEVLISEATRRVAGTPSEYFATATSALVLAHMGKTEDAKRMMAHTRALPGVPNLPQLKFVDAWIAIKEGRKTDARNILSDVRMAIGSKATKLDQLDFELIENAIK